MKDEINLQGKTHISSKRAAQETGLVQDYIGQLVRSKKIEGQKVGKTWFIDEKSLRSYIKQSKNKKNGFKDNGRDFSCDLSDISLPSLPPVRSIIKSPFREIALVSVFVFVFGSTLFFVEPFKSFDLQNNLEIAKDATAKNISLIDDGSKLLVQNFENVLYVAEKSFSNVVSSYENLAVFAKKSYLDFGEAFNSSSLYVANQSGKFVSYTTGHLYNILDFSEEASLAVRGSKTLATNLSGYYDSFGQIFVRSSFEVTDKTSTLIATVSKSYISFGELFLGAYKEVGQSISNLSFATVSMVSDSLNFGMRNYLAFVYGAQNIFDKFGNTFNQSTLAFVDGGAKFISSATGNLYKVLDLSQETEIVTSALVKTFQNTVLAYDSFGHHVSKNIFEASESVLKVTNLLEQKSKLAWVGASRIYSSHVDFGNKVASVFVGTGNLFVSTFDQVAKTQEQTFIAFEDSLKDHSPESKKLSASAINYADNIFEVLAENISSIAYNASQGVKIVFSELISMPVRVYRGTLALFGSDKFVKEVNKQAINKIKDVSYDQQGLVIVKPEENELVSEQVARVKKAFSDYVTVRPEESGESGVIQPVFKSRVGDEYLYVLVPLEE